MFVLIFLTFSTIQQLNAQCQEYTSHMNYHLLDLGSTCGHGVLNPFSTRILGSANAGVGALPWMVFIDIKKTRDDGIVWNVTCGGTLINNKNVLTAAQCFYYRIRSAEERCAEGATQFGRLLKCSPARIELNSIGTAPALQHGRTLVSVGLYQRTKPQGVCEFRKCSPPSKQIRAASVLIHESFDPVKMRNDIALLRLEEPVEFNDYIRPICLPLTCNDRNTDYSGTFMTIAGWGFTSFIPEIKEADKLRILQVPVVAKERCADYWENPEIANDDSTICAGGNVVGTVCYKDWGGPLMAQKISNNNAQFIQIGIISQTQCANDSIYRKPGIYTKVGPYIHWILENIDE